MRQAGSSHQAKPAGTGRLRLLQSPQSALFLRCRLRQVRFSSIWNAEGEDSPTKLHQLIFTHGDWRAPESCVARRGVRASPRAKASAWLLNPLLTVLISNRCPCVRGAPGTGMLAVAFCWRGTECGDFPHAEMLSRSACGSSVPRW